MMLYYLALVYGATSLLYMFFFMSSNNQLLKLVIKVLPVLILFLGNCYIFFSKTAPFDISASDFAPRLGKLVWSLLFCMLGDAYLVFPSLFLYGLISFAVGQVFLIMVFSEDLFVLSQLTRYEVTSGLCVLVVTAIIYIYMYPRFKCAMVVPTLVYALVISLMLWCAIIQLQKFVSYPTACGAAGAGLFYTSDLLLAVNKWRTKIPMARVFVMSTYYSALLLIALSVTLSH